MGNNSQSIQQDQMRSKSEKKVKKYPNIEFHQGGLHYVRPDIQNHINNWETYEGNGAWKQFYRDLESDHSFIQWIFPNFFKSMFNYDSYRLSFEERNLMIKDETVMKQFEKNYRMFLRFLGIEEKDSELKLIDTKQFNTCVFINTHNQMRLQRVLASLSVLNHRKEALNLLKFLKETLAQKSFQRQSDSLYYRTYKNYEQLQEEVEDQMKPQQQEQKIVEEKIDYKQTEEIDGILKEGVAQQSKSSSHKSPSPHQGDQSPPKTEVLSQSEQSEDLLQFQDSNQIEVDQKVIKIERKEIPIQIKRINQEQSLTWETQKTYYLQKDLLGEDWVTVKLLTDKF